MSFQNESTIETKICPQCGVSFDITDKDLEFYEKVSPTFGGEKYIIPMPNLCPECRKQNRLIWVNQRYLYKTSCVKCDQSMVSRFHPDSGLQVYCNTCWASDDWDYLEHGKSIDFSRSIFDQIRTLIHQTPFQNLIGSLSNIENNAVYTNYTADIADSYMVSEADSVERCYYSVGIRKSNDVFDSTLCSQGEESYECVDSHRLYQVFYGYQSSECSHSMYIKNCHGCNFCIGCTNLIGKRYHILNQPVSEQQYISHLASLQNIHVRNAFEQKFKKLMQNTIVLAKNHVGSEGCSGNNIAYSKNCDNCFDILGSEELKYCDDINNSESMMDISAYGSQSSYMYEGVSVGRYSRKVIFSATVGKGEDLIYCIDVKKSKHCFACVNLKDAEYCILNKQYSKEEYEELVPKIIEKMREDGEWGEFFPASMSPFGYNETIASEYYPLDKQQATKQGFNWSDYEAPFPKVDKTIPANKLPDSITDIPDDILNWAVECEITKKPFRIIPQELEFYRKHNLPIPRRHPDQRHLDRMSLRNPRKLFMRTCDHPDCSTVMQTTYAPERSEKVYCEQCYNKEIY